jgi:hypothetical protein
MVCQWTGAAPEALQTRQNFTACCWCQHLGLLQMVLEPQQTMNNKHGSCLLAQGRLAVQRDGEQTSSET